jgi:hypothetical protein
MPSSTAKAQANRRIRHPPVVRAPPSATRWLWWRSGLAETLSRTLIGREGGTR